MPPTRPATAGRPPSSSWSSRTPVTPGRVRRSPRPRRFGPTSKALNATDTILDFFATG
ncbi:hypothetical protein LV779_21140 [Streptomyces thinghirensis]|nr:hypothetical protein [Streptomyces thinghirensis]